jgi:mono/diheme cytochrome c family protein
MSGHKNMSVKMMLLIAMVGLTSVSCASSIGADDASVVRKVERGKYLVTIGGCNDCHTPWKMGSNGPEPDMTRMLSGHPQDFPMPTPPPSTGPWMWSGAATNTAFAGPWGVSYTFNLTPDEHTGIGSWSEETFMKTIRSGRHMGVSRPILPPMPWFNYKMMTDDDLRAVYAYLRSIPPVSNIVPDAIIASELATD